MQTLLFALRGILARLLSSGWAFSMDYDLDIEKDRLGERLQRDVHEYAASG